ncbi:hypothetical protein V1477_011157 [Vespula maculifrons]|uniref:Uncharacterized protein n=1 Tax=Vespula maculifrons TaxID=7453 RepID=A0ABD2C3Z7_VESMC
MPFDVSRNVQQGVILITLVQLFSVHMSLDVYKSKEKKDIPCLIDEMSPALLWIYRYSEQKKGN